MPNDAAQSPPATTLTIEARDLDTDAREQTVLDAVPPRDPSGQRTALVEAVRSLFPGAKFRSFANGAATFLDAQHLIVASYADVPKAGRRASANASDEKQSPLFAA
jgi:hypothetical protein